jgi:hypothetical protein
MKDIFIISIWAKDERAIHITLPDDDDETLSDAAFL